MKALKGLMKKVSKGEGGFTLIELLIVIIILGILAMLSLICLPPFFNFFI